MDMNNDGWAQWTLNCLGLWGDGDYLDKLEANFGVEIDVEKEDYLDDVHELFHIRQRYKQRGIRLGDFIAHMIFEEVIITACEELHAYEDDFEYELNGSLDTHLYCKGEEVKCWSDIEKLYTQDEEDQ